MSNVIDHYEIPSLPASFSGVSKLYEYFKGQVPTKAIKKQLSLLDSFTLHGEAKRPRQYNSYRIIFLRQQIQMDLIDMSQLAKSNDGVHFLLTAIDMFSKYTFCEGMKSKSAKNTLTCMQDMIKFFAPYRIKEILSDEGKEFDNKIVKEFLSAENIKFRTTYSEMKCAGVERVNRTIQNKLYKYLTQNDTDRYIDVLPEIMYSYNNTRHRTIQMTPTNAEKKHNHLWVRDKLMTYYTRGKKRKPKLSIGDIVRIVKLKGKFSRGYKPIRKLDLYIIRDINTRMPIPMYLLKSMKTNQTILGGFYESQLIKVSFSDKADYKVDRILETRIHNGKKQSLVKWTGKHAKYNSWIDTPEMEQSNNV